MSAQGPRLRAEVSHDLCVGSAMCLSLAPGAFRLDAEGLSLFVVDNDCDAHLLREAADGCPMRAITLIDGQDEA
jgi:ferredoxin